MENPWEINATPENVPAKMPQARNISRCSSRVWRCGIGERQEHLHHGIPKAI
jgi:hypothetical protein